MTKIILAFYIGSKKENPETTFFDRLVCWATNSRYSHVEIVLDYNEERHSGLCWSSSPRDGGVRSTIIAFNPNKWELFEVETGIDKQQVYDWFNEQNGKKYDWLGAFSTKIVFLPQIFNRWFCSEAISASLNIEHPSRKTPECLFKMYIDTAVKVLKKN